MRYKPKLLTPQSLRDLGCAEWVADELEVMLARAKSYVLTEDVALFCLQNGLFPSRVSTWVHHASTGALSWKWKQAYMCHKKDVISVIPTRRDRYRNTILSDSNKYWATAEKKLLIHFVFLFGQQERERGGKLFRSDVMTRVLR